SDAWTEIEFVPGVSVTLQLRVGAAGVLLQVTVETPESESVTVPVAVSAAATRTALFAGELKTTTGAVLSRLIVEEVVTATPALLTVVPETILFAPSVFTRTGDGQVAI